MYSPAKETTDSLKDKKRCIDEMLLGYTINGAIQLGIEEKRAPSLRERMQTSWYSKTISSRRSMKDSAITCRAACISA
jgi:hypothetical protein